MRRPCVGLTLANVREAGSTDDVDGDGVDRDVVVIAVTSDASSESVHGLHNRVLTTNPQNQIR